VEKQAYFLWKKQLFPLENIFFNWNPFYYKAKKALNSKIKDYYAFFPLEQ